MQKCETLLPGECVRLFGLATFLAALFIAAQVMMSFHAHDPFSNHEDNEPVRHSVECSVCLVADMPSLSGDEVGETHTLYWRSERTLAAQYTSWSEQTVSPAHARAPPLA